MNKGGRINCRLLFTYRLPNSGKQLLPSLPQKAKEKA